ncbi:MAG: tetratricopeptide repeat protein, partial [Coprothermobacterota bacterium]|nr:tetratricopeptide repeat protein [Coprothermobacterota bacterium]
MNTEWEMLNDEVKSLRSQGRYDRAIVVAKKALQVAEQEKGPNHSDVATILENLSELYRAQNQLAQAEPLYNRALAIREKALGSDQPDVATSLNNPTALYQTQSQYAQAEALGKIGEPRAVAPLIAALRDSDGYVRTVAIEALGKIGASAMEPLSAALKDSEVSMRQATAQALGKIGDPHAVQPLIAA